MEGFVAGDLPRASLQQAPEGTPSHWLTFVVVPELTAARSRVGSLGGRVLVPEIAVPGIGTFTVISDPQGAVICPFQPESAS
jgi:predicted enzyme related to lactoylglutathione lyase